MLLEPPEWVLEPMAEHNITTEEEHKIILGEPKVEGHIMAQTAVTGLHIMEQIIKADCKLIDPTKIIFHYNFQNHMVNYYSLEAVRLPS